MIRWGAFMVGIWVMALGIVMMIQAEMGLAPWDVFHMGLANISPLTVGMWLQIVGFILVSLASLLSKKLPGPGAVLNMILVGFFVDLLLGAGWIPTPDPIWAKIVLLLVGLLVMGIGNGLYIAPRLGAGPRDGLVIVLSERLSQPIRRVRAVMEISVLIMGWLLGGPVFIGTLLFSVSIGPMMQTSIQFWERQIDQWLGRGVPVENINQRTLRSYHHDGFSGKIRG
ncbi:hypothetical protein CHM34_03455 [Paludifilum halophilum]|uniref:YitT family protein n=2 Tax=Paludifilum halophilum TaxID=1642702 RepID=A0A235BA63_9BACL|nr:hypothetical protein CHM34_03455 [Paludifilum halophilum]